MFKEIISKLKSMTPKIFLGSEFKEEIPKGKMKGEFFITLTDEQDGSVQKFHYPNIIVDTASILVARLLADGQALVDPTGPTYGLKVLAVGTGDPAWDPNNPPAPTADQEFLEAELARKQFSNVTFIRTDGSGLPANEPTNIIDFTTTFSQSESTGAITELALFGGGTGSEDIINTADSGIMLNYRTVGVINKSNTTTMSIVFRITT